MAWERKYETKVLNVRDKELKAQKLNYTVEVSTQMSFETSLDYFTSIDIVECYLVTASFFSCPSLQAANILQSLGQGHLSL
jgi:hypothetical protein